MLRGNTCFSLEMAIEISQASETIGQGQHTQENCLSNVRLENCKETGISSQAKISSREFFTPSRGDHSRSKLQRVMEVLKMVIWKIAWRSLGVDL